MKRRALLFPGCIVLCLFLVCASACQWGVMDVGNPDGADAADTDVAEGSDGVEMDVPDGDVPPDRPDEPDGEDVDADEALPDEPVETVEVIDSVEEDGTDAMDIPEEEEAGCTSHDQCDDNEECNGEETCGGDGLCYDGTALEDGTECETPGGIYGLCADGLCIPEDCGNGELDDGEDCDDGNDVSGDGCENNCAFSCHGSGDCGDGEVCTDDNCVPNELGRICQNPYNTASCNDGIFCTATSQCNGAGECVGSGNPCDDEVACTDNLCDEDAGCTYPVSDGFCLIGGTCRADGFENPANDCQECNDALSRTGWSNKPARTACDGDGIGCTDDECNGRGACVSTPDDDSCEGGVCTPGADCADDSGCVTPPGYLGLSCETPVTPPDTSDCGIDLDSLTGQTDCLSCTSEVGMVLLDYSDFGDDTGSCDSDGWSFTTGNNCKDHWDSCDLGGGDRNCMPFSTACIERFDTFLLHADDADGDEQWRMSKTFDTTGIDNLILCFDFGDDSSSDNEGLRVNVRDGTNDQRIFCEWQARENVDDVLYPTCIPLSTWGWTGNNPALEIEFRAHSEDNDDIIYVDNVSLRGWVSSCDPTIQPAFSESFDDCDDPIVDGWNGWAVTDSPKCPGFSCPDGMGDANGAEADNEQWTMTRTVDASELDGNVTLCFDLGDDQSSGDNSILVEFNANDGDGWQEAWLQNGSIGTDQTCMNICVNLSDIDTDVNRNPALRIRFDVDTRPAGNKIDIDDILVAGAVYCDGAGTVTLGAISESGGGTYAFTVADVGGGRVDADIQCSWDPSPAAIFDWAPTSFIP